MGESGIVFGALSPHAPVIVPGVDRDAAKELDLTIHAMREMAAALADSSPDTVMILSPHGQVQRYDTVALAGAAVLTGSFRPYAQGAPILRFENDRDFVDRLSSKLQHGLSVVDSVSRFEAAGNLDISILVTLHFLAEAGYSGRLVAGTSALAPDDNSFEFGRTVAETAKEAGTRVAFIANGDLSHALLPDVPNYPYDPMGKVFEQKVVDALKAADASPLLDMDPEIVDRAAQCGLGVILSLLGSLARRPLTARVLSHEGPFGVGYCVATFVPGQPTG